MCESMWWWVQLYFVMHLRHCMFFCSAIFFLFWFSAKGDVGCGIIACSRDNHIDDDCHCGFDFFCFIVGSVCFIFVCIFDTNMDEWILNIFMAMDDYYQFRKSTSILLKSVNVSRFLAIRYCVKKIVYSASL